MPKRTNEFQDLITLIERALAPQGAKVTESAMVPGLTDDNPREIDVLIESMVGPYNLKIAVEAKDEIRRMDITKFESIIAKYSPTSGIKVDKVVVISRMGFSAQVEERATREGIELLTLSEAMVADWASRSHRLLFMVEPHIAMFEFDPSPENGDLNDLVSSGTFVCTCCGRNHGSPLFLAQQAVADPDLVEMIRVAASKSGKPFCALLEHNLAKAVILRRGDQQYRINRLVYCP